MVFKKNYRPENQKDSKFLHKPETKSSVLNWNWIDLRVYNFFLVKFEAAIEEYGRERMEEHVKVIQEIRDDAMRNCIDEEVDPGASRRKDAFLDTRLREFAGGVMAYNIR